MFGEEGEDVVVASFEGASVIRLRGEWDVATRERLRTALQALGTESDAIVDLREATFFDSTALAELIAFYKCLNAAGRRLEALVGESNMRRLLELTSLDELLGVSPERGRYLAEKLPRPS